MRLNHLYLDTMKLDRLLADVKVSERTDVTPVEIAGITHDSRLVRPGYIFAALSGARREGTDYVSEARERGAVAFLSEHPARPEAAGRPWIRTPNARRALAEMACAFYEYPSRYLQMIGVTGTNGKTTTSYLARDLLVAAGRFPGLLGTVGYEIGEREIPAARTTPEAPDLQAYLRQMLVAGCNSAVMEVSSHALMQYRTWGIDYDVGVFTNLSEEHLDYHGGLENYFAAKARLFHGLGQRAKRAVAVINVDDEWGARLLGGMHARVQEITYGLGRHAQVRAESVAYTRCGCRFLLQTPWGGAQVRTNLPGRFNLYNTLAACAACGALGLDPVLMADALAKAKGAPGRMEAIENDRGFLVFVDYAHTVDALGQALTTLRPSGPGRLIVVFGCGGDRDRGKRAAMGAVASRLADWTIVTTDNARTEEPAEIAGEVLSGMAGNHEAEMILDRGEAITRAIGMARPGDVVLIAGKGHECYQEIGHAVVPFDDREVARMALEERA